MSNFSDFFRLIAPLVIVDGTAGEVIINPTKQALLETQTSKKTTTKFFVSGLREKKELKAVTRDGHPVRISANVECTMN